MLNDITVRNMKPPASGSAQYPDGKIKGMGLRVTASGSKSFFLEYRFQTRKHRLNLGRYPVTSLAKARAKAHAALAMIAEGTNPQGPDTEDISFSAAVDLFVSQYCQHTNRPSTAEQTENLLRGYFLPAWERRTVESLGKADIAIVIEAIVKRGKVSAARHAFAAIRRFFNWMVEQGRIPASPCAGLKPPGRHVSRDHVLTDDELATIWRHTGKHEDTAHTIIRLLLLTAQRTGEVCGMAWDEIDFGERVWTMAGSRTKNHKPHAVPLTDTALAILKSIPRTESPFVFPARGKPLQPYAGYTKPKMALDAASGVTGWTLHDLRRTAATGMARAGMQPHIIERVLNHVSGTFAGVAGVYNRFQYMPEMREALALWERHVLSFAEQSVDDTSAEV